MLIGELQKRTCIIIIIIIIINDSHHDDDDHNNNNSSSSSTSLTMNVNLVIAIATIIINFVAIIDVPKQV